RIDGEPFLARVYQPRGAGPFPALLDLHGGAWSVGSRATDEVIHRALAASGILVFAPDFRLAPTHPYPASIADTNLATRWLKAHAVDFNGTSVGLGVRGGSSGGHMAMLSAMRPWDARYTVHPLPEGNNLGASVTYVIACWSILAPHARYFFARETGRQELVKRTEGYFLSEEAMQEGSPKVILDRGESVLLPPVLILQGTEDTNVTPALQREFVQSYRARGGEATLQVFEGMPHSFIRDASGPESERALGLMKRFIARQLERASEPAAARYCSAALSPPRSPGPR